VPQSQGKTFVNTKRSKEMKQFLGAMVALALIAAQPALGDLVITEVMSNSDHPGGAANGDWWELTNTGSPVDLTGYYWDDDGPSGADGSVFPNIVIGAGQSIVISDENAANLAGFVAAWGGGFTAISVDDFGGPDPFSGLSSGGDQIEIWDADPNAGPANLVASVVFGDSDGGGKSFEWFTDGTPDGFSVDGEYGAYIAPGDGAAGTGIDVGSPGIAVVPEPATMAMFVIGGVGLIRRRR
jgi:hypothetical protein